MDFAIFLAFFIETKNRIFCVLNNVDSFGLPSWVGINIK